MKALGIKIEDRAVLSVLQNVKASNGFTAADVAKWFVDAGLSPFCKDAAADNLLRRMKRADLIKLDRYRTWKCCN